MRNKRLFMMLSVLALSIGFATVSTVLYINGTAGITGNVDDLEYNVIFTKASTDDGGSASILQEGKRIEFETKKLEKANDKTRINYEMTNLSRNYDIGAKVVCALDIEDETTNTYKDIVNFQVDEDEYTLASGSKKNGYVEITILHNPEHEVDLKFGCEIVARAIERSTLGKLTVTNNNSISGILTDVDENPVSGYLEVFSDEMKVVEIAPDGSFNVTGLEDGTHEIYYMGSTNPINLTKGQIKESAIASGLYATSTIVEIVELTKGETKYIITKTKYKESILNGTDPIIGEGLIPVVLSNDGTVTYVSEYTEWYKYEDKEWANAIELIDSPSKEYKEGDIISNDDIKGYFVWVPRYRYKIFNEGNYSNFTSLTTGKTGYDASVQAGITSKVQAIEIVFEDKENNLSNGTTVGSYLTHPAFTNFDTNGIWVAKFEITGNMENLTVKPGEASVVNQTVSEFWNSLYSFDRNNDSHMIKNTEWGAVAYLSHSIYGINQEITINNNENLLTGFAAAPGTNQSVFKGEYGTTSDKTLPWITEQGYTSSTTGNISGIYGMSGGAHEYVAAYISGYGVKTSDNVLSGFISDPVKIKESKYFDVYSNSANKYYAYNNRILGDATGEMGPFYNFYDKDGIARIHASWYFDFSNFAYNVKPWFYRGGTYNHGILAGPFSFSSYSGTGNGNLSSRLVLAPNN